MHDITEDGYYRKRLREIEELYTRVAYCRAVRECGVLIEYALQRLLDHFLFGSKDANSREEIQNVERETAKETSGRSYRDFTLGPLVHLYHKAKVFDALGRRGNFITPSLLPK